MRVQALAPDEWSEVIARGVAERIGSCVEQRGRCRLALAGGRTPAPVYRRLAAPPFGAAIPWSAVTLFFSDERAVSPEDPSSNYAMIRQSLIAHVPALAGHVERICGELPPVEAARAYADVLGDEPIDILLLGMGADGHVASLFPDTPELLGPARVRATRSPVAPHERVSLGLRTINEAAEVMVLVTGRDKAPCVADVRAQLAAGKPVLPAALVQPASGRLTWFVDHHAAERGERSAR